MSAIEKIVTAMRDAPQNVRYADLSKVCKHYLANREQAMPSTKRHGKVTPALTSNAGDNGKAKMYQVRQVLAAIKRLKEGAE